MEVVAGKFHKGNDEFDLALAIKEDDGEGYKVVVFPEPGGTYDIHHNVPTGQDQGHFSQ